MAKDTLKEDIAARMDKIRDEILGRYGEDGIARAPALLIEAAAEAGHSLQTQFEDWGRCGDVPKTRLFKAWAKAAGPFTVGEAIEFYARLGSKRLAQFMVVEIQKAGGRLVSRGPLGGIHSKRSTWSIT